MNFVAFALRAIPDTDTERRRDAGLAGLGDDEVAKILFHRHRQNGGANGGKFPPHQMRIAALAWFGLCDGQAWGSSLASDEGGEAGLLAAFLQACGDRPLVSWQGEAFDLPLLRLRALHHGLSAATLFESHHRGLRQGLGDATPGLNAVGSLLNLAPLPEDDCQTTWAVHRGEGDTRLRGQCEREAIHVALIHLRLALVRGELDRDLYPVLTEAVTAGFPSESLLP